MDLLERAVRPGLSALLIAGLLIAPGTAQDAPKPSDSGAGGPGQRLLRYYQEPPLGGPGPRSDSALEGLIKDGKLRLTEEDIVRLVLENNIDVNVERYTPYFALWAIDKGKAVLNPTVSVGANVNRMVTPATSLLQGGDTVLNLASSYDIVTQKPTEYGGDFQFSFSAVRARTNSTFVSLNPSLSSNLSFGYTQHLLKDFGRTSRGRFVRIARNNLGMSEEDFVARVNDIVSEALSTYWELVYTDEDIKVKEASKSLAEVILQQNRIQVEVGTMADLDVVQAEAEVATRNEQLVTARFNRRIAEDQLKKLICSRPDPGVLAAVIEPGSSPVASAALKETVQEAIRRALEKRPELKRQSLDLESRRILVNFARNQLLPSLDLTAGYTMNGLGGTGIIRDYSKGIFNPPLVGIQPGGFWDSLDSLFSRRYLGYNVGLSLRIPIGNDDARANSAQARIDLKQGEERLRALQQRVALDVRQAWENIEMSAARVETAQVTVRYSERKLQGEQDKYGMGATTTRFIFEAQRDLQDARTRLLRARIDLIKGHISLEKATGDTFSARKIELRSALGSLK